MAVYDEWEAANEKVAALSLDALTHTELLELQHRREVVARSLPATDHQIINRLVAEADPKGTWRNLVGRCVGHALAHTPRAKRRANYSRGSPPYEGRQYAVPPVRQDVASANRQPGTGC